MKTFSNDLLSTVNGVIGRLGPVASLLDGIIERIAPPVTAQACSGVLCTSKYCTTCCANCNGDYLSLTYQAYATNLTNCVNGNYNCFVYVGCTYC